MSKQKIAVFVDVQNIYYTVKQVFGRQFNYKLLWQRLSTDGEIVIAHAYAIDRGDQLQKKFQNALRQIGFNVKLKPYIQRRDGSTKGDWDVGITIDILEAAKQVDKVVLLSGDGDFDRLLSHVREEYETSSQVISVTNLTAQSLIEACDEFSPVDLALLL
ncbi:MAG: uncharacterized LabA/DUF88 family protein [Saprospiraceae bacterium]|jgi:uncharacterized LabA/DUF88 family protein